MAGRTVGIIGPDRIGGDEWRRLDAFEVGFEPGDAFETGGRIPTRIRCAWTCAHGTAPGTAPGTGTGTAPGPAGITLLAQPQEATKGDGGW
ncbi:hypothetical protein [Frankia sp. Cj3]|uniref:hypothetical protein n=1 Tax=Frankia sp. Cj3 TaxID=2880976 RepID=UPI001EF648C4|nr:hypothetical protein [Frankia sp. Cj3]